MNKPSDYPVAIIGSGNIGTDLMIKILRSDGPLRTAALVGIDPASDGLARAERLGIATTADEGVNQHGETVYAAIGRVYLKRRVPRS